jgi:hypothetical protein
MLEDLDVLMAEQMLLREEIEAVKMARIEVKLRRKIVNDKRRNRNISNAKLHAIKQTNFFGSTAPVIRYKN